MNTAPTDFIPAKRRIHRKRRGVSTTPAPPLSAPVLLSASFTAGDNVLALLFDRAIDLAGLFPGAIVVLDGTIPIEMGGTGDFTPIGDNAFSMVMIENGEYTGSGVLLDVSGAAGIVAADGGVAWEGVADLELPFPS